MRRKPLDQMPCSIARALDVLGDPWTLLIVRDLHLGVRRFEELSDRLGIPRATLTTRLTLLTDAGVVEKVPYQDGPPRSEYLLTAKGLATHPVVVTLLQWGDDWLRDDEPPSRLVEAATGRRVDPVLVDRATGVPLDELGVRVVGPVADGVGRGRPS